jgi:subtilisin family serine protease
MFNRKVLSLLLTALAVTTHTAHAQNRNRFLVKGTNGQTDKENQVENVAKNRGGKVIKKLGKKNRQLMVVEFPSNANPNAVKGFKNRLKNFGYELDIDEPMYPIPIFEDDGNGDSRRKLADEVPWGIANIFKQANGDVSIPNASYFPGANDITKPICIIDSGYMKVHPDLPDDATNADPAQFSGSGTAYDSDRSECSWHGTHVAGTIAAMDNEVGVLGVFPGLPKIKVVRVFSGSNCGYTYTSDVYGAVQACADSGAKVVTMSLGCDGCYNSISDSEFQSFYDDGILSIAAAGNSGNTAYSYPASYSSVMSVGAISSSENIVSFSQHNDQVDIAAPGSSVKSTTGSNSYSFLSGTSMATPHVSGAATLLWNKFPQCTNKQVRDALQNGALDKGAAGKDIYYGHGILRYYASAEILANNCGSGPTSAPTDTPTMAPCDGKLIEVDITTDNYASETTWTLTNKCTGETLLSGGPYGSNNSVQPTQYVCVQGNSDYEFVINDSYGDGICCAYGSGSYKVTYGGVEAASGGSFTYSETKVFGDGCGGTSSPTKSPTDAPTKAPTDAPTKAPTDTPTKSPTDTPTKSPTEAPVTSPVASPPSSSCPAGQSLVEVDIKLDNYPSETSWSITACNSNQVLLSGGSYFSNGSTISESKCLSDNGSYQFTINDTWGDGICCGYGSGNFNVKFGGTEVASGGAFGKSFAKAFGHGVINGECPDLSVCPLGEKLLKVAVKADYYPGETSWSVDTCDGTSVVSGTTGSIMQCVPDFSYTFTIFDSYGDGICCSYGQGSYEVTLDGAVVASGGAFAFSEQTKFNGICPSNRPIPKPVDVCSRILRKGKCKNTEGCAWSGNANNGSCAKAPKEIPEKARNN